MHVYAWAVGVDLDDVMMPFNGMDKFDYYLLGGRWTGRFDLSYDPTVLFVVVFVCKIPPWFVGSVNKQEKSKQTRIIGGLGIEISGPFCRLEKC